MFRKLALGALLLTACTQSSAPQLGANQEAIIGGTLDGTGHPSVVMLYAELTDSQGKQSGAICTGEVISPHVVLTAAHCVDPAAMTDDQGNALTINGFVVYLGDDLSSDMEIGTPGNLRKVKETHYNPAFDINNLTNGNDIAVVVTETVIPEPLMAFNKTALASSYQGKTVTLVGYGIDDGQDSMGTSAGVRRTTTTKIASAANDGIAENDSNSGQLITLGSATHNTCHGDSGGPAIYSIGGVDTIIGVTSFGDSGCSQYGVDTDVGSYYDSWLKAQIDTAEANSSPDPTGDGGSTSSNDMAQSGGGSSDAGGGGGGSTDAGSSGGGSTTGGSVGEVCQNASDCASGICTGGSAHYCTQSCELNVDTSCPVNMKCELVGGSPYCVVPAKSSGCSAASGAGSAPSAGGALFGILLLLGTAIALRVSARRV